MASSTVAHVDKDIDAIEWDDPEVVQLESCNSCGTNSGGS